MDVAWRALILHRGRKQLRVESLHLGNDVAGREASELLLMSFVAFANDAVHKTRLLRKLSA